MKQHGNAARILMPGLALSAAILAGALLAAERPATLAEAPEQVRVRLVSAMAKWRSSLLRVVESRRAESLSRVQDTDHGHAFLALGALLAAPVLPRFGIAETRLSPNASLLLPCPAGRAPPVRA